MRSLAALRPRQRACQYPRREASGGPDRRPRAVRSGHGRPQEVVMVERAPRPHLADMRSFAASALPAVVAWTVALGLTAGGPMPRPCCSVLELRQYTLKPGGRDVLIELFEQRFVESQEELGMRIAGTFRDAARPERFVWVRGFDDMESRRAALESFYTGPVWKANREAANAT